MTVKSGFHFIKESATMPFTQRVGGITYKYGVSYIQLAIHLLRPHYILFLRWKSKGRNKKRFSVKIFVSRTEFQHLSGLV